MNTKRFSFTFALALGMLVMLMLPLVAWQGATVAHAQGPDVNAALLTGFTVQISPTTTGGLVMDVGNSGNTIIQAVESNTDTAIYKSRFEIKYDVDIIRRVSIVPSTAALAAGGVIGTINDDNDGTIFFNLETLTGLTITAGITPTDLVNINWQCLAVGTSPIDMIDVDINVISMTDIPAANPPGTVTCDYLSSAIGVDPTTVRTINIGDQIQSTVLVTNVNDVYGIDFGLKFDPTVVEVEDVQAAGLMANSRPTWEVRGDTIIFVGRSSKALNGSGPIATITWKGIAPGTSPETIDGVNTKFLDKNLQQIVRLQTSAPQPETRVPGGNINVSQKPAELYFEKAALSVNAGQTTDQDVKVSGINDMSEILFRVSFDPTKVQVEDQDPNRPGVQVKVGSLFGSDINVAENVADNVNGTIDFRVRSQTALNSDGQVASIKWLGLTGATNLSFVQHAIFDANNANIQHSVRADSNPGSITVSGTASTPTTTPTTGSGTPTSTPVSSTPTSTPVTSTTPTATPVSGTTPTATPVSGTTPTSTPVSGDTITGRVRLQGRTSHTDFKVYADVTPCNLMTAGSSNEVAVTPTNNGTNDATFTLQNKGYQCLMVVRQGHLSAQRNNPAGNLGFIELPGGDFTASGAANTINIFDLSYAGSKFGAADALADFNGDGKVDIFDLAIVAGNYGRTGPISW